jgi:hypothetical protein
MMTLEQFYATHRLPNAIVVPGRVARLLLKRRSGAAIAVGTGAVTPAQSLEAVQLLRRFRGDGPRGKKN